MDNDNRQEDQYFIKRQQRLGIDHDLPGVDAHLVQPFAKVVRLIGTAVLFLFLAWGLFSDWSFGDSPFQAFLEDFFSVSYRDSEAWQLALAGAIGFFGWLKRFTIGNVLCVIVIGIFSFIARIFKAV